MTNEKMLQNAVEAHGLYKDVLVKLALDHQLNDVVAPGRVQFLNDYMEYYFEDRSNVYSKEFTNPTYLDLAVFVNDQIHEMEEEHHVFLEKVLKVEEKDGVQIFSYELGS